jgi:H2-forming N5,N10-methylenetetrahydromethanopterin dehydrogenase-like enzyme
MVFSTWLRTMTREADDLTTLLNHSTKDLGTVAKEFAEAKKYMVSNLDKLQYELRTEVVEVVGDVGTVLEKMITAWRKFITSMDN